MLHLALSGFGSVEPIGDTQLGQHVFCHLGDAGLGHFRFRVRLQLGVLFLDTGAHSSHALERELGDWTLLFGHRRQDFLGAGLAGAKALWLRALRNLGRCLEMWLFRAVGPLTLVAVTGGAALVAVAGGAALVAVAGGATTTVVAVTASAAAASFTVVTAAALAAAAFGLRFNDGLEGFVVGE